MEIKYNSAQKLLMMIGGNALLVSGYNGHYLADSQTPKRVRKNKIKYGEVLRSHFEDVNLEKIRLKNIKKGIV